MNCRFYCLHLQTKTKMTPSPFSRTYITKKKATVLFLHIRNIKSISHYAHPAPIMDATRISFSFPLFLTVFSYTPEYSYYLWSGLFKYTLNLP